MQSSKKEETKAGASYRGWKVCELVGCSLLVFVTPRAGTLLCWHCNKQRCSIKEGRGARVKLSEDSPEEVHIAFGLS